MRSLNRAICTSGDPVSALPRLFPTITCRFTSVASAMLEWLLLVFSLSRFGYGIRIPQGGAVGAGRFFAAFRATPADSRPLSLARGDAETADPRAPVEARLRGFHVFAGEPEDAIVGRIQAHVGMGSQPGGVSLRAGTRYQRPQQRHCIGRVAHQASGEIGRASCR